MLFLLEEQRPRHRPSDGGGVNHWGQAAAEVRAGIGTIRGGPVKDAGTPTWVRSAASRGNDVQIYLKAEDQRAGNRGLGSTTLGRVAYFFEHQGND